MKNKKAFWIELSIVAVIIFLGAFVRFVNLSCLPPGLYPDEAMNTTDGLRTAEAGGWQWFYENNNGREGLYINILGYLLHWFGPSIWIVRFLPALVGTLTLPAVYWLGRRLCGRFGSIVSLSLVAFSYWHLNFSRVGFRAIMMVLLLTWTFAFMVEGFWQLFNWGKNGKSGNSKRKWAWVLFAVSGLLLGLSLHTYIAVRIAPAVVAVLWIMALIFFPQQWKSILRAILLTIFFAVITATPMLYDFAIHPDHFSSRTGNVSVLKSEHMLQDLSKSVLLTMASFVVYGDQNWRHNYPYLPLLLPIWGVILFISVILGTIKLFKELGKKLIKKGIKDKNKNWEMIAWGFLIVWWLFLLAPSILTNEGLPHALRSIGALVPAFILVGFMIDKWSKNVKAKAIFSFLIIISAFINIYVYFFVWGRSPSAYAAFENRLSGMGIYLREEIPQEPKTNFYLLTNQDASRTDVNLPVSVEPIRFFTWQYRDRLKFVLPEDFSSQPIKLPAKLFLMQDDNNIIQEIKTKYPNARVQKVKIGENTGKEELGSIPFAPAGEECFLKPPIGADSSFSFLDIK